MTTESTRIRADVPLAHDTAPGAVGVIWALWATYGAFYFCRQNISAALPGMETDLGFSKAEIGFILGALKIAYAVGQLVNGQLAERYPPRQLLAVGMLGSAVLNVIFGLSTGLYFLLFVWACNGYCQALGWTPCMRVVANWIAPASRGRLIGILGTSYQVTAALTFLIAGWSAYWFGWRGAFYIPSALLTLAALHMLLVLREAPPGAIPEETDNLRAPLTNPDARVFVGGQIAQQGQGSRHPVAPVVEEGQACRSPAPILVRGGSWGDNLHATLTNPALWLLALSLALLDACRYGFTDWGLTHLKEVQGTHVGLAALKYAVLPAGGIAGALLAGWATDRFFQGRRAPVITGLLVVLGLLTLGYDWMARTSLVGTVLLLALIGFCIFGPQVLLVGTAPADLARRGTAAAAAGFVNFMGYLGAFTGDWVTGHVAGRYGWQTAVFWWAGWAFAAAVAASCLWNTRAARPDEEERSG